MPNILLSVLIPAIPEHLPLLVRLVGIFEAQADPRFEVLIYMDNKRRPLGCKRNTLMDQAQGKYLCHIDDDDMVSADFARTLLAECEHDADLIAYDASCSLNGSRSFRVFTGLDFDNEQPKHLHGGGYSDIRRKPWHWSLWRTELARKFRFPDHFDAAEDWTWLKQILPAVKTHRKVDKVLYHHIYNAQTSSYRT